MLEACRADALWTTKTTSPFPKLTLVSTTTTKATKANKANKATTKKRKIDLVDEVLSSASESKRGWTSPAPPSRDDVDLRRSSRTLRADITDHKYDDDDDNDNDDDDDDDDDNDNDDDDDDDDDDDNDDDVDMDPLHRAIETPRDDLSRSRGAGASRRGRGARSAPTKGRRCDRHVVPSHSHSPSAEDERESGDWDSEASSDTSTDPDTDCGT